MKKIMLFVVVLLVSSMLVFAGGSKEPVKPAPVMATGEWMTYNDRGSDGGSSISNLVTKDEEIDGRTVKVHHITGNVTTQFIYGFAGWGLDADNATMELYKTAESFTFYVLGDGKKYTIKFKISTVEDYAYHEYTFETVAGEAQFMEIPMGFFAVGQPAWGAPVKFDQTLVTGVEWQTHESWRLNPRNNPFDVKMWDFMIQPAPPSKKPAAKSAAPAEKPGVLGSFDLILKDNFQYGDGYQGDIRTANLLNGHKLSVGDSFTVKFTYSASRDLEEPLEFGFVDQTPTAQYWRALSWEDGTDMPNHPATKKGESVTVEMTFKIVKNATSASAGANTFVFSTKGAGKKGVVGSGVQKAVTLTFKEFTLVKN